ncbi:MAG: membrane dipeptidase [Rhodospirillales bacterium]
MHLSWTDLTEAADGAIVEVAGYPLVQGMERAARTFLILPEPRCCIAHAPADPLAAIEVFSNDPISVQSGMVRLTGQWRVGSDGWRYRLHNARTLEPPGWRAAISRRAMATGPLMCLAVAACATTPAKPPMELGTTVDIHSHAGNIASMRRMNSGMDFTPIAAPMRQGGMAAICLAVVSDSPTHRVVDGRIRPYRDPAAGELFRYGSMAFDRALALAKSEGLGVVATAADLSGPPPRVVIAAEGADFLEGRIERVDEAHRRWTLRHLQLTHYRPNELGDIQTEPAVHGGLTDFGAEVVRRCNRLGIVVDVAHGTLDLVKRAAAVSTKPLVLSHTSLAARPGPTSRQITAEHAKVVASTGGVIGVWPVIEIYPNMNAMAVGMARLVDVVGVDHVALGTDLRGLVGSSTIRDYDDLPLLADALSRVGFGQIEVRKILGGNYVRVFAASLAAG